MNSAQFVVLATGLVASLWHAFGFGLIDVRIGWVLAGLFLLVLFLRGLTRNLGAVIAVTALASFYMVAFAESGAAQRSDGLPWGLIATVAFWGAGLAAWDRSSMNKGRR